MTEGVLIDPGIGKEVREGLKSVLSVMVRGVQGGGGLGAGGGDSLAKT